MYYLIGLILVMLSFAGGCDQSVVRTESKTRNESLVSLKRNVPSEWQDVDLGRLVLKLPRDMKRSNVQGTDSTVWEFVSDDSRMIIDLGTHANDLSTYTDWPNYRESWVMVDLQKAKLCSFRHSERFLDSADGDRIYISAIYFPRLGLSIWYTSKNEKDQVFAEAIFSSIRFVR